MFELDQEIDRRIAEARRVAVQAGAIVAGYYQREVAVEEKAGDGPVTIADRDASRYLVQALGSAFPQDGVLSEEERDDGSRLTRPFVWVIDPLDGTKEFIQGNGEFCTMVGLLFEGRPVAGAISVPHRGRLVWAARGQGAWLEEGGTQRRLLRQPGDHPDGLRLVRSRSHMSEKVAAMAALLGVTEERPLGSVGLKITCLAEGYADLYVSETDRTKLWDACAPDAVLSEAGGSLTDLWGQPLRYDGESVHNRNGLFASAGVDGNALRAVLAPHAARILGRQA